MSCFGCKGVSAVVDTAYEAPQDGNQTDRAVTAYAVGQISSIRAVPVAPIQTDLSFSTSSKVSPGIISRGSGHEFSVSGYKANTPIGTRLFEEIKGYEIQGRDEEGSRGSRVRVTPQNYQNVMGSKGTVVVDGEFTAAKSGNLGNLEVTGHAHLTDCDVEILKATGAVAGTTAEGKVTMIGGKALMVDGHMGVRIEGAKVKIMSSQEGEVKILPRKDAKGNLVRSEVGSLTIYERAEIVSSVVRRIDLTPYCSHVNQNVKLSLRDASVDDVVFSDWESCSQSCIVSLKEGSSISSSLAINTDSKAHITVGEGSSIEGSVIIDSGEPSTLIVKKDGLVSGNVTFARGARGKVIVEKGGKFTGEIRNGEVEQSTIHRLMHRGKK